MVGRSVGLALLVLFAVGEVREADACSCATAGGTLPRDGASDVPLNAGVLIYSTSVRRIMSPELSLRRTTDDAVVPVTVQTRYAADGRAGTVVLTPSDLLEPNTEYATFFSWGESIRFTTGIAIAQAPPSYDGIAGLRLETESLAADGPACIASTDGWYGRVHPDLGVVPENTYIELELWQPGHTETTVWFPQPSELAIRSSLCSVRPPALEPDAEWCARAIAYNTAGQSTGESRVACGRVQECDPDSPSGECHPAGCSTGSDGSCTLVVLLGLLTLVFAARSAGRRSRRNPS